MNKKLSKALALMIPVALMATGCSTQGSATQSSANDTTQESTQSNNVQDEAKEEEEQAYTLEFWHSMSDGAGEAINEIVEGFNSTVGKEKNITVNATYQGKYTDSTTKLNAILQGNQIDELPDVMQLDATGVVSYNASDNRYTVEDALKNDPKYDLSDIMDVSLKAWNFEGVQAGMPFSSSTTVMYYNKTMLEEVGIIEAPTTFEEMIAVAELLPEQTANGNDIYGLCMIPNTPTLANWIGQIPGNGSDVSYVTNNINGRDGIATQLVADEEGTLLHFIEQWKKMYDAGVILNQSSGDTDMFFAGQLAFMTGSSAALNRHMGAVGDNFELGIAYYPRIDEASNFGATVSGSGIFMFNKEDDRRAEASWEFVKYLVSPEVQAYFTSQTGYFPNNHQAYETDIYKEYVQAYPLFEVSVEQINMTSPDMLGVIVGPSYEVYLEMMAIISEGLEDGTDAEEIVEELSNSINGLLNQYVRANQ